MASFAVLSSLNKLCLCQPLQNIFKRNISVTSALQFRTSTCLMAEPLKKKKRLDPAVVKAREERRKKKIEKQIRRLEKNARQLKPLEECGVSLTLLDEKKLRERVLAELSPEVVEYRTLLEKKWAAYKCNQHLADIKMLDRIHYAQQRALDELRKESEELYQEAIQIDFRLLPFKSEGPLETPPIEKYDSPDGDYLDVSKKWQ